MRTALTRVEILVTVVALFIVWALLMPVVERGRDESRRSTCVLRLYDIVGGLLQYELAQKKYPRYVQAFGQDQTGNAKIGTWVVALLPYIGREGNTGVYGLWQDPNLTEQWNRRGGAHPLNSEFYPKIISLTCPRDENTGEQAPLSYAVNCGFFADTLPADYDGLNTQQIMLKSMRPANGIFSNQLPAQLQCLQTVNQNVPILGSAIQQPTRSSDVRDGLTQTICAAENLQADSWSYIGARQGWGKTELDDGTYYGDEASATRAIRVHVGLLWLYKAKPQVPGVPDFKEISPPATWSKNRSFSVQWSRPSSGHAGVYNAGFAGGSVSAISKGIDYRIYQALMAPNDSQSDIPDKQYRLREEDFR